MLFLNTYRNSGSNTSVVRHNYVSVKKGLPVQLWSRKILMEFSGFSWPSNVVAVVMQPLLGLRAMCYARVCGDAVVNKPVPPVVGKHSTYSYVRCPALDDR